MPTESPAIYFRLLVYQSWSDQQIVPSLWYRDTRMECLQLDILEVL